MAHSREPPNFLNGVPALIVLRLLLEQPMYGYELIAAIISMPCTRCTT